MSIITKKTLNAGNPGTRKWMKEYGDKFVCVRYKYDSERKRKIKTVEPVVEEEHWAQDKNRIPANKIVNNRINYGEVNLGKLIRYAGGKWNRGKRLWELPYRDAVSLDLVERIVEV